MGYTVEMRDYGRVPSYSTWVRFRWWVLDASGEIASGWATEAEAEREAERLSAEADEEIVYTLTDKGREAVSA